MSLKYSLSDGDIRHFFKGEIKILTYTEVEDYNTLEELVAPYGRVVILWQTSPGRGHWTCLMKSIRPNESEYYFFDSYGIKPENQLRYSAGMNRYLKQRKSMLLRLFENHNIKYNDKQLQKLKKNINTCGRHVLCRLCFPDLNNHEYYDMIKSKTDNPDQFVTDMTKIFLGK